MSDPPSPAAIPPTAAARLTGVPRRGGGMMFTSDLTSSQIWGDLAVEFLAAGTAVRTFPLDSKLPSPTFVLAAAP